jgi:hypothetical protein
MSFNFKQILREYIAIKNDSVITEPMALDIFYDMSKKIENKFNRDFKFTPGVLDKNNIIITSRINPEVKFSILFSYKEKDEYNEKPTGSACVTLARPSADRVDWHHFRFNKEEVKKAIYELSNDIQSILNYIVKNDETNNTIDEKDPTYEDINTFVKELVKNKSVKIPSKIKQYYISHTDQTDRNYTFEKIISHSLPKKYIVIFDWAKNIAQLYDREKTLSSDQKKAATGVFLHSQRADKKKPLKEVLFLFKNITGEVCFSSTNPGENILIHDPNKLLIIGVYGKSDYQFDVDTWSKINIPTGRRYPTELHNRPKRTEFWLIPSESVIKFIITNIPEYLKQAKDMKIPVYPSLKDFYENFK